MQNSPTVLAVPPPRPATQINVIPIPPSFDGAPNSVFPSTFLPFPPPPPFAGPPSSVDLSPLEFLLALLAVVTIPALIYTFIFAFGCPSRRRRREPSYGEPSVASEVSHHQEFEIAAVADTEVKYRKEAHAKEIGGECPVCLSVFANGEEVRQLSACKHSFHASCIDLWLSNHSNCPICRATIAVTTTKTGDGDSHLSHQEAFGNKECFGNLHVQSKEIIDKMNALDVKDEVGVLSDEEILQRKKLLEEYLTISTRLDSLLHQQSISRWLKEWDQNSRFFHSLVRGRRRVNVMKDLSIGGRWEDDLTLVKEEVKNFFQSRFLEEDLNRPTLDGVHFNSLESKDLALLDESFDELEVKEVVGCLELASVSILVNGIPTSKFIAHKAMKGKLGGIAVEEGLIGRYASLLNCRSMGLPFTYLGIPIGANPSKEDMWKLISIDNYLLEMWKLISIDNYLLEEDASCEMRKKIIDPLSVVRINLNHGDIARYLSKEPSLLTELVLLQINTNRFCGTVPHKFDKLKLLFELDLSNNCFVEKFLDVVLCLSQLKFLDLRFNKFKGSK
ncbi:Leucine-rich repeat extensin-like protein 4 [Glycine soja]|uniref:Leucine-rich repeat extensin-like protein 4 n=1 Tax=Glycine soja TaxID=3848 RepID=A0A445FUE6_GLYSO|nr:Leucine-rich repeat extensin-like protein 4 [Glycine soja]